MSNKIQLLIIDDSPEDIQIFRDVTQKLNCDAFITQSFEEAEIYAQHKKIDILISDLNIGSDSGFDIMRGSLNNPNSETMKRILYTTESPTGKQELIKQYGILGWIVKPANYDALLKTLTKLIERLETINRDHRDTNNPPPSNRQT